MLETLPMEGMIFNIQKMSVHDGPGIRSTVFFKGCPLRCLWCSNPESQNPVPELACFANLCIGCGACVQVCPKNLIEKKQGFPVSDHGKCDLCGVCVKECCTTSKQIIGEKYTQEALLQEILKDKPFYDSSGGGVTFSGGEPLMQADFLIAMLKSCREEGLHTAIETTGFAKTEELLGAAKYLDLIFMDVKHMDDEKHRELTGVSNRRILSNLKELSAAHSNITVRIPVIPGLNDSEDNIKATADYAADLSVSMLELLPYHNLGENKYGQLGREYSLPEIKAPSEEYMAHLGEIAKKTVGKRITKIHVMPSY